jgi:hypothetical protein
MTSRVDAILEPIAPRSRLQGASIDEHDRTQRAVRSESCVAIR